MHKQLRRYLRNQYLNKEGQQRECDVWSKISSEVEVMAAKRRDRVIAPTEFWSHLIGRTAESFRLILRPQLAAVMATCCLMLITVWVLSFGNSPAYQNEAKNSLAPNDQRELLLVAVPAQRYLVNESDVGQLPHRLFEDSQVVTPVRLGDSSQAGTLDTSQLIGESLSRPRAISRRGVHFPRHGVQSDSRIRGMRSGGLSIEWIRADREIHLVPSKEVEGLPVIWVSNSNR